MIYVTGDTHGNFRRFQPEYFPEQAGMTKNDVVIIAGDYNPSKFLLPKKFQNPVNKQILHKIFRYSIFNPVYRGLALHSCFSRVSQCLR